MKIGFHMQFSYANRLCKCLSRKYKLGFKNKKQDFNCREGLKSQVAHFFA